MKIYLEASMKVEVNMEWDETEGISADDARELLKADSIRSRTYTGGLNYTQFSKEYYTQFLECLKDRDVDKDTVLGLPLLMNKKAAELK